MPSYLITGGAGFIGSHLTAQLLEHDHRVMAIDNLSTGNLRNIAPFRNNPAYQFARAELTDEAVLDQMMAKAEVVIHLAAAVGVELIVEEPVRTIETNVGGTEAVLKAALKYGCRVLLASSSEVYGKGSKVPFEEDDDVILGATSRCRWAYAASKMIDEFLGLAYHRKHELEVVVMRFFNTVGPGQTGRYGMVIPRFVRRALEGDPLQVYGDGKQSRCFCDVHDVTRAIEGLAGHRDSPGRVFNIGGQEEITILELAGKVKKLTGSEAAIELIPYEQAYPPGFEDMRRRVPSTKRIEALLGWKPTRTLDEVLASVVAFERAEA